MDIFYIFCIVVPMLYHEKYVNPDLECLREIVHDQKNA
jgi:hypothetical protein